ncbi:MAG: sensor histidine kinase [Salibacteraceae bacterium]
MLGERYLVIRDSLKGKGDQRALGEVIIAYENARDQYEKDLLIRDRKRAIAGGIAVILILSVFFYLRNRYKQKALKVLQGKNQEIEARNHQIELLFRELNHRVKNNLMVISSLLKLQARQLTDEGARSAIQESRNRVEAMGLIHQKLYQNAQISHIRLSDYLRKLVPNLLASYGFSTQSVDLEMEIADMEITIDTAVPLGLVVNELVSNAFKYAYKNVDAPWLKVSLQPQGEQLELLVQDNGPGLPEEFNNRREGSFGLKLVHSLTRQMRGKLTISNRPGACFQLLVQDTPKNANKPSDG